MEYLLNENNVSNALVGCILGDSSFEPTFINIMHSIIYKDYVDFKYNEFSRFFNVGKIGTSNNWGSNKNEELRKAKRFRILRGENYSLDDFRLNLLNENNKRIIPENLYLIQPVTLFFWYMDDGTLIVRKPNNNYKTSNIRRRLSITLKSFSDESILKLIEYLNTEFNLEFRPDKNKEKKIIRITTESVSGISKFLKLFYDNNFYNFIPDSLHYKFNPEFKEKELDYLNYIPQKRSTTIETISIVN